VAADELEVPEQEEDADRPGDRRQRQVVAAHAQGDETKAERDARRHREPQQQIHPRQPWPCRVTHRQIRRDIRADAHERRLAERGLAGDAGQQHEAERDDAVEPDIVEQRNPELRRYQRRGDESGHEDDERRAAQARAVSHSPQRRASHARLRGAAWSATATAAPG
jgi:hypothetical protein